jgi:CHAD domain-containing protein
MQRQLVAPTDWTAASLEDATGRSLEVSPWTQVNVTHLDTHDWRIFRAGATLSVETDGSRRTLHWNPADETSPYVLPVDREVRVPGDLPDGFLRSKLEPILDIRALMTLGTRRAARQHLRVADSDGNAVARLILERSTMVDGTNKPAGDPITLVRVIGGPGNESVCEDVVERLRAAGASEASADHELAAAAAAIGRSPGDYSSKINVAFEPDERADAALRAILAHLLATLRANVDGVLGDTDTEFLHDFRVATRRARSALAQVKGVLDRDATAAFALELKWLGSVTNPCRDLDVYLLEMDGFRRQLGGTAGHLDPLHRMLEHDRRNALGKVRRALHSERFSRLIDSWEGLASSPPESGQEPPNAARPIVDVAGERIIKAYRRMVTRGSKLIDGPSPEMLHRLRIDGKKLRYLLEFFASLYGPKAVNRLVKELKQLQDILGGFNDMTVQQARLLEFAEELMASGEARPETLLAMGRLAAAMARRQDELHHGFSNAFAAFASPSSQQRYSSLFSRGER